MKKTMLQKHIRGLILKSAGIVLVVVLINVILAILMPFSYQVPSMGVMVYANCMIYQDSNLTSRLTALRWGTVFPLKSYPSQNLWIQSTSNAKCYITFNTTGFYPPLMSKYLNMTWSLTEWSGNQTAAGDNYFFPYETKRMQFTLNVGDCGEAVLRYNITNFNFYINVYSIPIA